MALHALAYCERLFYLEEVEEIRRADRRVFLGRALHERTSKREEERGERISLELGSENLGLVGRVDCLKRRRGGLVPYEHKRGRARRGESGRPAAWPSDALQVGAYALLLEEHTGSPVAYGLIRYHAGGVTVRVGIGSRLRARIVDAIARARQLRTQLQRPPVADNPRLCRACSLAPICLPEEERKEPGQPVERLFPEIEDRRALHVVTPGASVHRSGRVLEVRAAQGKPSRFPIAEIAAVVLHGYSQITTQALHQCSRFDVAVHWVGSSGRYIGGLAGGVGGNHRRLRQYEALRLPEARLDLARRLALARIDSQRRYLMRATRGRARDEREGAVITEMDRLLRRVPRAGDDASLRGLEGQAGKLYFSALPKMLSADIDKRLRPQGRSRRPPKDRFNALLSFGYGLLYRQVLQAILTVGLEPAFGFFHTPRSAAAPLVLDVMELFRVALWDMPLVGSINRRHWDPDADFDEGEGSVYLSQAGRRKAIPLFERRLLDTWKHPVLGYSLSYGRTVELEVRLLEKEWSGREGLFATARLR